MTREEETLLQIAEENHFITPQQKQEVQLFVETLDVPGGVLAALQDKGYINSDTKKEIKTIYKILMGMDNDDDISPKTSSINVSKIRKAIRKNQEQKESSPFLGKESPPPQEEDLPVIEEEYEEDDDVQTAVPSSAPRVDLSGPIALKPSDNIRKGENRPIEIEGYTLLKVAGRGNQAVVFKAQDQKTNRVVAVKILNPNLANETRFERFFKEAKLLTSFDHPNIAKGFDFGESNGYNYFVMEFLKGSTSKEYVEKHGPMTKEQLLAVSEQITYALIYANSIKLIHRDIKPDNIMIVGEFKQIKLCDLGLAKALEGDKALTQVGQVVGTPNYISPEIARGENPDIRSDLYSLGATLYYLATGAPPFIGENATSVMRKHIFEELTPPKNQNPSLDPFFSDLIVNLLQKAPLERPQTPDVLLAKIKRVRNGKSPNSLGNFDSYDKEEDSSDDFLKIDATLLEQSKSKKGKAEFESDFAIASSEAKTVLDSHTAPEKKPVKSREKTLLEEEAIPIPKSSAGKTSEKKFSERFSRTKKDKPSKPMNIDDILDQSNLEETSRSRKKSEDDDDLVPREEDLFRDLETDPFKKDREKEEEEEKKISRKKSKKDELADFLDTEENLEVKMFEDEFKCRTCGSVFSRERFTCPNCYQKYCVYCRRRLKVDPRQCGKCGRPQPGIMLPTQQETSEEFPVWGWAIIACVVVVIIIFFIMQSSRS